MEIGVFQVFFVPFFADVGFWVNNGGGYVNLRGVGDMGKIKASKNVKKLA